MTDDNEYVKHVLVSAVCANRDCPNSGQESSGGTYSLVRFTHPDGPVKPQITWATHVDPPRDVDIWLCTSCAVTVMAAANPPRAEYVKLLQSIVSEIEAVVQGRSTLDLTRLITIQESILGTIGGAQEVR